MSRRNTPTALTVFAVASLGVFIAFVDATIVNIAFPDIRASFPASSISDLSWVLNAYNIVFAAFLVAFGRFADVLGRRRVFLVGLVLFTSASLLCALASSPDLLIGFRVLQALGAAALVPSSLGLVLNAYPAERRTQAVALLTAVAAVAAGIGPSLGGLLVSLADWRLVFLVNVPIGVAAFVLSRRHLVESRTAGRRRMPDMVGAGTIALAVALVVLGIVQGDTWGWGSPMQLGVIAVGLALSAWFARRCTRHPAPLIDPAMARVRPIAVANSMSVLAAAGFYGYTLLNVLFLTGVWGYTVLEAGLAVTPGPFVAAAVAGPASALATRLGHRWVLLVGGLIWAAAVTWLITRVGAAPAFVSEWLPGTVLLGIGAGITLPNLSAVAVAGVDGDGYATATGVNSVARQTGGALGVAIAVALLGTPTSLVAAMAAFDDAWTFAAACLLVAGLGSVAIGRITGSSADSLSSATRAILGHDRPRVPPPTPAPSPRTPLRLEGRPLSPTRAETPADFLAGVPLFAEVPEPARAALAERTVERRLRAGEWLLRAGDRGDSMFVVRAGRLVVLAPGDANPIRELARGESLGELALLTGDARSVDVRAARATRLLEIDRGAFEECLADAPRLGLAISRTLARQLREHRTPGAPTRTRPATITLVPLGPSPLHAGLGRHLADALRRWESVVLLDGSEVPAPAGGDPVASYGPMLDRLEGHHDRVLLLAPSATGDDPWSEFCIQHADRVLAVAGPDVAPVPAGGAPADLRGGGLVGWNVEKGSGALSGWVEALEPEQTFAVGPSPDDLREGVERIARRLSGRSIGIVLSGGGARAFAHIGVLAELAAAGLEPDRVAGVSMGAYVGALYALGQDPDEIDARCFEEWVRHNPIADYTLPRHALIRGRRFTAMLERSFGTTRIEELERDFFCACADLRGPELVLQRWGPLAESVGLSAAMPILGPPQVRGRRILVDGSLIDNLPVESMARMAEGPIIAVDVKASFERGGRNGTDPTASANGAAATAMSDGTGGPEGAAPRLAETLTRVLLLGSSNTSAAARRHADLTIKPPSEGVGLLEFHQIDSAIESGRRAAAAALSELPASLGG